MNARIAKETRVLLPVLAVVLALIILPFAVWGREGDVAVGAFIVGCVVLAAVSFGAEFQNRTLSMLLVQPVPRAMLWREKMLVLGAALLATTLALAGSIALFARRDVTDVWPLMLVPLSAFCVTPCLTLLMRGTLGGVGASLCLPLAVVPPALWAINGLSANDKAQTDCGVTLVLIFCAVLCRLGYVYFGGMEVLDGASSRQLRLPEGLEKILVQPLARMSAPFAGPFASLLRKELRLQNPCFLVAGVCAVTGVVGLFIHSVNALEGDYPVGIVMAGTAFGGCVGVVPLLAGAIALGEERSWGMADWHLSLPPSAWKQWAAKMAVALATSLLLGFVLPVGGFLVALNIFGKEAYLPGPLLAFVWAMTNVLATSLVVYGASLATDTLKGILFAMGFLALPGTAVVWLATHLAPVLQQWDWVRRELSQPLRYAINNDGNVLIIAVLLPMIILTWALQRFGFTNFRLRHALIRRATVQVALLMAFSIVSIVVVSLLVGSN